MKMLNRTIQQNQNEFNIFQQLLLYYFLMGAISTCLKEKQKKYYEVIKLIVQGTQTKVYLIKDLYSKKQKVLKKMVIEAKLLPMLSEQKKHLLQLIHSNIIKVDDVFEETINDVYYMNIIMEYIDGGQLQNYLNKLTTQQIVKIYNQIKSAIEFIHERNIIHKNITLKTILLDQDKNAKLTHLRILSEFQTEIKTNNDHNYLCLDQNDKIRKQIDLLQFGIVMIQLVTGTEISELMKNQKQSMDLLFDKKFLQTLLENYKVNLDLRESIFSLLKKNYKERRFSKINQNYNDKGGLENRQQQNLLAQIQKLQYQKLNLRLNGINDSQFSQNLTIHQINYLMQLNCSNNQLTDNCGIYIIQLGKLSKLDISGNNLTDKFIMNIQNILIALTELKISFTQITDESLFTITELGESIQSLDISYTRVTSMGIISLLQLTKLSSLAIWSGFYYYPSRFYDHIYRNLQINYDTYIGNVIAINIECIKQLQKLQLKQLTINLKDNNASEIVKKMDSQSKCVEIIGKIDRNDVQKIVNMCKLQQIYLKGVQNYEIQQISSEIIESVALVECKIKLMELIMCLSRYPRLIYLDLTANKIDTNGAIQIARNFKYLKGLNLSKNNIGNRGCIQIAKHLLNLAILILQQNSIGNEGAIEIARNMKNLIVLKLNGNNIGNQGVLEIAKNLDQLIVLNLKKNRIDQQTKQSIIQILKTTNISI